LLEPPLYRNTAVSSRPRRPVVAPPSRRVPVGPALPGTSPSSYVRCPRRFPRASSPSWTPLVMPARRRARGHHAVTTSGVRAPRSSQSGRVAAGPHGRPSCHRTRAGFAHALQAVCWFEAQSCAHISKSILNYLNSRKQFKLLKFIETCTNVQK
jgi:hypothetical protein